MPIIGTAGHVDHGKSTLVEALTGRDPDRWAEEKERGLTIDLGFAWTTIRGHDVGFVDVPGHERFIKNMLAGVGAVDCALLVVASDSGWMPQTEEHATVLDLLNTRRGVIALTRVDLVDEDTIELATLEVLDEVAGTALVDWPIVPVSAVTGVGIPELLEAIADIIDESPDTSAGPLHMWVDRSFSVSGAGTVATGTIARGSLTVGDEIQVLPMGTTDRVRGLHHHDAATDRAVSGARTAINLQSIKYDEIGRGSLVAEPRSIGISDRFLATLTNARAFDEIPQRGAFHVHLGTAHSSATIRQVRDTATFVIRLDTKLPLAMGDRFILRDAGRQAVVGGGRVLDPTPPRRVTEDYSSLLLTAIDGTPDERATVLLKARGVAASDALSRATGGGVPEAGIRAGTAVVSDEKAHEVDRASRAIVSTFHRDHPLRPGVPKSELASQLGIDLTVLDAILRSSDTLDDRNGAVQLSSFDNALPAEVEVAWATVRTRIEESFDVPRLQAIGLDGEIVHALIRRGDLVQIGEDLAFTAGQIDGIHSRLGDFSAGFSVAEFRDAFGMTRRQAVPTLEWLDKTGWTRRDGDGRTVRRRR